MIRGVRKSYILRTRDQPVCYWHGELYGDACVKLKLALSRGAVYAAINGRSSTVMPRLTCVLTSGDDLFMAGAENR